jgi:hypothetical protein
MMIATRIIIGCLLRVNCARQVRGAAIVLLAACWPLPVLAGESIAKTTVGMEGVCRLRYDGPAIEAKAVGDKSPLVLRISPATADSERGEYELHYIANRPGTYDLRDWLVRSDGLPLPDIAPLSVQVVSLLPADDDGTLANSPSPALPWFWPYRWLLVTGIALWASPLVWHLARKLRRQLPVAADEPVRATLADQLRPLIAAAVAGRLESEDLARLESLLHRHWRRRLGLEGCTADESLQQLRSHPEAGRLLGQLDQWLYKPPSRQRVDIAAILLPYRDQAALDEQDDELAAARSNSRLRNTLPQDS